MNRLRPTVHTRARKIAVVAACAAILLVGVGYLAFRLTGAVLVPSETTDLNDYAALMRQWSALGLISHFPATIPTQAKNVRLSSFPGYLQGGAWFQIRMQLPADEVAQIENRFGQAAPWVYVGGDFFTHHDLDQKNNVPTTHFYTADDPSKTHEFPSHYTLYVLGAKDHSQGSWNHGSTSGVAVSSAANEVIYWADSW